MKRKKLLYIICLLTALFLIGCAFIAAPRSLGDILSNEYEVPSLYDNRTLRALSANEQDALLPILDSIRFRRSPSKIGYSSPAGAQVYRLHLYPAQNDGTWAELYVCPEAELTLLVYTSKGTAAYIASDHKSSISDLFPLLDSLFK